MKRSTTIFFRYLAFALLVSPIVGIAIASAVAYGLFREWYSTWTWGIAMGLPVGLFFGLLAGLIPAKGYFLRFSSVVSLSVFLFTLPIAFLGIAGAILPMTFFGYLIGIFAYYSVIPYPDKEESLRIDGK